MVKGQARVFKSKASRRERKTGKNGLANPVFPKVARGVGVANSKDRFMDIVLRLGGVG